MIRKIKRLSRGNIQDNTMPTTIEQLITKYDLDNIKIYNFLDELVEQINLSNNNVLTKIGNWGNTEALKDYMGDLNTIRQTGFTMTNNKTSNAPNAEAYYVLTLVKNPDYYVTQIAIKRDSLIPTIFVRIKTSHTWGDWIEIPNLNKFRYTNGLNGVQYVNSTIYERGAITTTSVKQTIVFPVAFSNMPRVFLQSLDGYKFIASVTDRGTQSFAIDGPTGTYNWFAWGDA